MVLFFSLSLCFCLSRFGEEERFVFASMCQAAFLWTLGDSPVDLTSQRHTFPSGCSTLSPSLFCSFFHSFFLSFFLSFILSFSSVCNLMTWWKPQTHFLLPAWLLRWRSPCRRLQEGSPFPRRVRGGVEGSTPAAGCSHDYNLTRIRSTYHTNNSLSNFWLSFECSQTQPDCIMAHSIALGLYTILPNTPCNSIRRALHQSPFSNDASTTDLRHQLSINIPVLYCFIHIWPW